MQKGMIRIAKFWLNRVLPYIGDSNFKIRAQHCKDKTWKTYRVKLSNNRMRLIGREQKCACCGLEGTHFWLEHSGFLTPHFNLYGINRQGHEVMLTMDHIVPRANGGKTEPDNLQLLCQRCNKIKTHHPLTLEELRKRAGVHHGPCKSG